MPDRIHNPLDQLYDIVNDLWGTTEQDDANREAARTAGRKAADDRYAARPAAQKEAPAADAVKEEPEEERPEEEKPAFPPFEQFWSGADESIDWTDAMVQAAPADGLTDPELWSFLHEQAEKVLQGDTAAYLAVLKKADPLRDLLPYAADFQVKVESADRMTVTFETVPAYTDKPQEERRRYLAGICLRAARDLMALLPVYEVTAVANIAGRPALTVPLSRPEIQKVRFRFVEPVSFCGKCGGVFSDEEAAEGGKPLTV